MKKITTMLALATCLASSTAAADTFLGIYAGAQAWDMGVDGTFGSTSNQTSFTFDDKSQGSFYLALEHPVPIVPNIKIKYNQMDTNGVSLLNSTYEFGDEVYSVNTAIETKADLTNIDFVFYYEILDNDLLTFDLGLNVKRVDGDLAVANVNDRTQNSFEAFDGYIPMIYGNVEIGLPFTGLGVFVDGSFLSVGGHTLYDYEAGIAYQFVDNIAVEMTVQLGYRSFKLELDDLDDIYSNLEFDGAFVGLEVHF